MIYACTSKYFLLCLSMLNNISFQATNQRGFTLIELMIVIAILGILSSIAVVSYQTYIRKAHLITIYQEINQFRIPYQVLMETNSAATVFSLDNLSIPTQTKYCQFSVNAPDNNGQATDALQCRIQNLHYLTSQYISLDRSVDGKWQCRASAGIPRVYLPQACQ